MRAAPLRARARRGAWERANSSALQQVCFGPAIAVSADYLSWVLRSASASSVLAVALLGLAAAPARRGASAVLGRRPARRTRSLGQDVGISSRRRPFGDLDGDGDFDLVVGRSEKALLDHVPLTWAAPRASAFVRRSDPPYPFDGVGRGAATRLRPLGDLDGDGDLDLMVGRSASGTFFYYENTGSATSPASSCSSAPTYPLAGEDVGLYSAPALGDLDGDGDLDLVLGRGLRPTPSTTRTPATRPPRSSSRAPARPTRSMAPDVGMLLEALRSATSTATATSTSFAGEEAQGALVRLREHRQRDQRRSSSRAPARPTRWAGQDVGFFSTAIGGRPRWRRRSRSGRGRDRRRFFTAFEHLGGRFVSRGPAPPTRSMV